MKSIDLAINTIVTDMYEFTERHPNWNKKVWDITQPKDDWGVGYAHLEYLRTGLKQLQATKIIVTSKDKMTCSVCGAICLNPKFRPYMLCSEKCDNKAGIEEDNYQQDRENWQ
jgi:hypothetical protein